MSESQQTSTPPRRRWFRFRLRTLLILVLLIACLCAWARVRMIRAQKLRDAVTLINSLGSDRIISYAHAPTRRRNAPTYQSPTLGRMESEPPSPKWLRDLLGDEYFVTPIRVWVSGPDNPSDAHALNQLDDEKLAFIVDAMPHLRVLAFSNPTITDSGCQHLGRLSRLESLDLLHSKALTDKALASLAENKQLKTLYLKNCPGMTWGAIRHLTAARKSLIGIFLSGPGFGDEGANILDQFPNLKLLGLNEVPISDESVPVLSKMKSLHSLELTDTSITPEGAERIKAALPTCSVNYRSHSRSR